MFINFSQLEEYEQLSQKIEDAAQRSVPSHLAPEFEIFLNTEGRNHPTIIKVISENREAQTKGLPHLVYRSREKRPKHPHYFKAGAMNVLLLNKATLSLNMMTNLEMRLNGMF
ncbi:hypothetical protein F0562_017254 [Nyssa sinensis]|uniref:Uncharacterized protein n=1 Tax=Nyssa sinensis TaxID=561372 RepID=A0A5J4ZHB5_9ASTE|nr:hypothetical protein F0562_017254 [Nyssa sinensis]